MRKQLFTAIALLGFMAPASAAFIPYGVQTDVQMDDITNWGWSNCYGETAASGGLNLTISAIREVCSTDYTMMGLYSRIDDDYKVLAAGESSAVFADTGNTYGQTLGSDFNLSNGVNWYMYEGKNSYGAMGFYNEYSTVTPRHCDFSEQDNPEKSSFCLHLKESAFSEDIFDYYIYNTYGYFNGGNLSLTSSTNFEVHLFDFDPNYIPPTEDGDDEDNDVVGVPEPSGVLLLSCGILAMASARKRNKA